jgi:hypothetical protein
MTDNPAINAYRDAVAIVRNCLEGDTESMRTLMRFRETADELAELTTASILLCAHILQGIDERNPNASKIILDRISADLAAADDS